MFLPRVAPSKLLVPSLVVATILASVQLTQAKSIRSLGFSNLRTSDAIKMRREYSEDLFGGDACKGGCAAFGHSCFGGHGKRADSTINPVEGEEVTVGLQPNADDIRTYFSGEVPRAPVEILNRDQPDDFNLIVPSQYQSEDYLRFSPLLRKWLANSYRRGDLVAVNK